MPAITGEEDREAQETCLLTGHEVPEAVVLRGAHEAPSAGF